MDHSHSKGETPSQALARELGVNAESDLGRAVLRHVKRWEETKNPHWIDLAVVIVTEARQPIPPCLQEMASHIAMRRINGMEDAAGGATVMKDEIKGQAFACIAFLIGHGKTLKEASWRAADATAAIFGSHLYKASTLETEYSERRKLEHRSWEEMFKGSAFENADAFQLLMEHLDVIPHQEDVGNRRE